MFKFIKYLKICKPNFVIYLIYLYLGLSLHCIFLYLSIYTEISEFILISQTSSFSLSIYLSIYEGGVLAFFMETSEFMLLSQTSSLTLAISSILKEVNSTIGVFSFFTIFTLYQHFINFSIFPLIIKSINPSAF